MVYVCTVHICMVYIWWYTYMVYIYIWYIYGIHIWYIYDDIHICMVYIWWYTYIHIYDGIHIYIYIYDGIHIWYIYLMAYAELAVAWVGWWEQAARLTEMITGGVLLVTMFPQINQSPAIVRLNVAYDVCCSSLSLPHFQSDPSHAEWIGLAIAIHIRCKYGIFCRKKNKYTAIYGVYIRFWPTLWMK